MRAGYVLMILALLSFKSNNHSPTTYYPNSDAFSLEEKGLLREGDIILRRGYGLVSDGIAKILAGKYNVTHGGLICDSCGKKVVMHAISRENANGMVSDNLEVFTSQSQPNTLLVIRVRTSDINSHSMCDAMKYYQSLQKPFDEGFDIYDTTKLYCTEVLRLSFMRVFKEDIFTDRIHLLSTDLLRFEPLYDSTRFEIILNHQTQHARRREDIQASN